MEIEGFSQSRDLEVSGADLAQAGMDPLSESRLGTNGWHK